ncbi:hypothetical protein EDD17DRAFT_1566267 [Pisolithus thermaeus]|nr:hypothetical protein EDD17DRAFT_1566267 [Pisolithus thermaeus]
MGEIGGSMEEEAAVCLEKYNKAHKNPDPCYVHFSIHFLPSRRMFNLRTKRPRQEFRSVVVSRPGYKTMYIPRIPTSIFLPSPLARRCQATVTPPVSLAQHVIRTRHLLGWSSSLFGFLKDGPPEIITARLIDQRTRVNFHCNLIIIPVRQKRILRFSLSHSRCDLVSLILAWYLAFPNYLRVYICRRPRFLSHLCSIRASQTLQ